jgi:hypothetical protein
MHLRIIIFLKTSNFIVKTGLTRDLINGMSTTVLVLRVDFLAVNLRLYNDKFDKPIKIWG